MIIRNFRLEEMKKIRTVNLLSNSLLVNANLKLIFKFIDIL